jgi:uncharacterized protein YndB with AHSA1/START domain
MTIERRLARADFTLTRDYAAPVPRTWEAFADGKQKRDWWGAGDAIEPTEWAFDFRVGGRDVAEGRFHDGPVTRRGAERAPWRPLSPTTSRGTAVSGPARPRDRLFVAGSLA